MTTHGVRAHPAATGGPVRPGSLPSLSRWVVVVATGELVGFLLPAAVGVLWGDEPWGVAALMAAGALEGAVLGSAQWSRMRADAPDLRPLRWIVLTAVAASAAYLLGLLPSTFAPWWTTWPTIVQVVVAVPLSAALLVSIGLAQWVELRRSITHAWWWIVGSAGSWIAGLGAFFAVATPLWQPGQPVAVAILIGVAAGAAMAVAMALVTGLTWRRLISKQPTARR